MKYFLSLALSVLLLTAGYTQDLQNLWHHADLAADSIPGVSLKQAYDYLQGRPSKKVLVAIIDSGYEIDHEALKNKLWVNEDEVAGNGIDDDKNGYVDDINGWNFIGGKDGNITNETLELTREYKRLKPKYAKAPASSSPEYKYWKKVEEQFLADSADAANGAARFFERYNSVTYYYSLLSGYAREDTLTVEVLNTVNSSDSVVNVADEYITRLLGYLGGKGTLEDLKSLFAGGLDYYDYQANYAYNPNWNARALVGDKVNLLEEKGYGNNQVWDTNGYGGSHGTHVSGIVGGQSATATIGITPNVEFMFIRAVPSGDERDKDVANAIMYAVDNGARVINMSFGKDYSPDQEFVRKAVKYADSKGVVMVHAAGNDGKNNDEKLSYPDGSVSAKKKAAGWIEVGAMSKNYNEKLPAGFSNYGKKSVDLFAPGVQIMSSMPDGQYEPSSGTSMAAPVVAGVSALLLSYFPDLTGAEVKEILMQSVKKVNMEVIKPGSDERVNFSELSKTGGVVNAFEAVKLADKRVKLTKK